jgi:hypothetical protein
VTEIAKDFTPTYCAALLGLHAYTRCDATSAFKGIGKVKPIKLLQAKPRFQEAFQSLGEKWEVTDNLYLALREFTCWMYKIAGGITKVDELRYILLVSKCGGEKGQEIKLKRKVDLPHPRVCLKEHVNRVNYQVGIWKRVHMAMPEIPDPTDNPGLEPKWCAGDILPLRWWIFLRKKCKI